MGVDLDVLVADWTLVEGESELVAGKRGPTRLGFALQLKFYGRHGRFMDGAGDVVGEVVEYVARQVHVEPAVLVGYDWAGRTAGVRDLGSASR